MNRKNRKKKRKVKNIILTVISGVAFGAAIVSAQYLEPLPTFVYTASMTWLILFLIANRKTA